MSADLLKKIGSAPQKTIDDYDPIIRYALAHSTSFPNILQEVLKKRNTVEEMSIINYLSEKIKWAPKCTIDSQDPVIRYALAQSTPLPAILQDIHKLSTSETWGRMTGAPEVLSFNMAIMHLIGAKKYIEIGCFCGASAVAAALVLPSDGRVVSADVTEKYFEQTRKLLMANSEHKSLLSKIDLRISPENGGNKALDDLIAAGESGTFDFAFIDADKPNQLNYYEKCLQLLRPGGVMVIDNSLWGGYVLYPDAAEKDDPRDKGETRQIDACNKKAATDERVIANLLPFADGVNFIIKRHC